MPKGRRNPEIGKPLFVRWYDHTGDAAWKTIEEIESSEAVIATTMGWLVHIDKKPPKRGGAWKVMNTRLDDGSYGGESLILKSCIIDYQVVPSPLSPEENKDE